MSSHSLPTGYELKCSFDSTRYLIDKMSVDCFSAVPIFNGRNWPDWSFAYMAFLQIHNSSHLLAGPASSAGGSTSKGGVTKVEQEAAAPSPPATQRPSSSARAMGS
jgi:hypothetical protein